MKNEYYLSNDGKTAYIKLTQGQVAIIDAEDLEKIADYRWYAGWNPSVMKYYVRGYKKGEHYLLHRVLTSAGKDKVVDHIDGDSLNNKMSNLRICTQSQNLMNSAAQRGTITGIRGVFVNKKRYGAVITCEGETFYLGTFDTIEEAAAKRKEAEVELFGEFSRDSDYVTHKKPEITYRDYLPVKDFIEGYGEVYKVPLTKNQWAIIDIEDYEKVSANKWFAYLCKSSGTYYARAGILVDGKRTIKGLHQVIMNAPKGFVVDHINGDPLDNRRCNLRICTQEDNKINRCIYKNNTSGYKGVSKHANGKWQSEITKNGKSKYLGLFPTPELAYAAYCKAALELHGEFARLS